MPRSKLAVVILVSGALWSDHSLAEDPHLNSQFLPLGCPSCHEGHGVPNSPMLPKSQSEVCLDCHDSQSRLDDQIQQGRVHPQAKPALIGQSLKRPFTHPLTEEGLSRFDEHAVVCSSCHSPHRRSTGRGEPRREGTKKISTRNPRRFEHELCDSCHRETDPGEPIPTGKAQRFESTNRSSHPILGPAEEGSPSLRAGLRQKMINCTDCHRPSRAGDPLGPHGSDQPWILGAPYVATDGAEFSEKAYGLCLKCHDSKALLSPSSPFPLHELHVADRQIACASCHSAHGATTNRALIRIGEETTIGAASPSMSSGRFEFVSDTQGSGSCYLTCHGVDHGPADYGGGSSLSTVRSLLAVPGASIGAGRSAGREPAPTPRPPEIPERKPPPG